jgi:predicted transcriptional regulator
MLRENKRKNTESKVMEIVWTQMARITYLEILENLHKFWTLREIQIFNSLTEENLLQITSGKVLHTAIAPNPEIRRLVVHENDSLYYKIDKSRNRLLLITFYNCRMDPELLRKLLNG